MNSTAPNIRKALQSWHETACPLFAHNIVLMSGE